MAGCPLTSTSKTAARIALLALVVGLVEVVTARQQYAFDRHVLEALREARPRLLGDDDVGERLPLLPNGYLYPVLAYGPNNQIAGLKEALVLGQLLQRTVIVHDIINHYTELGIDGEPHSMPFEQVFDLPYLATHRSIVSLAESREQGWDSRLDAVAHFGKKFLHQIKGAHALNVSDDGAQYVDFDTEFGCTDRELHSMVERLREYRYTAFILYENVVENAGHGVTLRTTGSVCHDSYLELSAHLRKSPTLVQLAQAFAKSELQGKPYLAVHLRPYPDVCLRHWARRVYDTDAAAADCKNKNLYNVFVEQTRAALEQRGLKALFVMCYPSLRAKVSELYEAAGIHPVYYDMHQLHSAVGYSSVSLLGMLEEEIAFEADVFIGTSYSSMTGIILQERYARGKDKSVSWSFTKSS